jgi:hypothetical protein
MINLGKSFSLNLENSIEYLSAIKDLGDLLQGHAASLRVSEVDDAEPHQLSGDKHDVILPPQGLQRYWVHKAIEKTTANLCQVEDTETLGAKGIWQHLEKVGDRQGRHGDVIKGKEDEYQNNDSDTESLVATLHLVSCRKNSPDSEGRQHADGRGEEQGSPADSVDKCSRAASDDEVVDLEASVDEVLRFGVGDADIGKDESKIAPNKLVTAPLDDKT